MSEVYAGADIRHVCNSQAALFEANALLFTGEKKAKRDGAGKAYRAVAAYFSEMELGALREEVLRSAENCCRAAEDIRAAFPLLAASFEGHACAYRDIAGLCLRLIEASDDHAYDAWKDTPADPAAEDAKYGADRGMGW